MKKVTLVWRIFSFIPFAEISMVVAKAYDWPATPASVTCLFGLLAIQVIALIGLIAIFCKNKKYAE